MQTREAQAKYLWACISFLLPVKQCVSQFMSQSRYTLGSCTIRIDADIFAVQQDGIVTQKVVAKTDVFQFDSPLWDDLFWIPGLIAANHSIGGINYACVQSRLLSSGVNVTLYRRYFFGVNFFASAFASRKSASISLINAAWSSSDSSPPANRAVVCSFIFFACATPREPYFFRTSA